MKPHSKTSVSMNGLSTARPNGPSQENAAGGGVRGPRHTKRNVLNRRICIKPILWNCRRRKRPIHSQASDKNGGSTDVNLRRKSYEHDHNERRDAALVQGLGHGTAGCL